MTDNQSRVRMALALMVAAVMVACNHPRDRARNELAAIDHALAEVLSAAEKGAPEHLSATQNELNRARAEYDSKNYDAVLAITPGLLADVRSLPIEAAGQDAAAAEASEWAALALSMPRAITAVENRLKALRTRDKLPPKVTKTSIAKAEVNLHAIKELWREATIAHAAADRAGAFTKGNTARKRLNTVMASLAMPQMI